MKLIQPEDILKGPFWPEKVRVIKLQNIGDKVKVEVVGVETKQYYNSIFSEEDINKIEILKEESFSFSGDGESLFLYLESHRIRNAFQFDPLCAVNVSHIDPLPHQIDAVYYHILPNPRIRFMLADDPGAGKTIMAGLLFKELKYRGLVERTIIVVPGHLKDQWLREMKEKFQENFSIVDRSVMNAEWGKNVFTIKNQIIISMDFAKQDDVMSALSDSKWDLCIIDEAHKMSAYKYKNIKKTQRYELGKLLSSISNYLLFLTATPHRGDPENFRLLLSLLEPNLSHSNSLLERDNPLFLRRLKEDLKDFEGAPIFPPRKVETVKYYLSEDEKRLYNAVTEYVENYFNKALKKEKRNVVFALTILQRRLASSVRAVRESLQRRYKRLSEIYEKGEEIIQEKEYDEDYIEDLEEKERWKLEEELLESLTSAETLQELKEEIEKLEKLINIAKEVEKKEIETKLNKLKEVIEDEKLHERKIKLLIFTEFKDTLEYLVEKLRKWGYSTTFIHGGMSLDKRIEAENEFRNRAQIMVSTEAGGEGINLQFCWLMVNYDIPWNPNRLEQRMGRIHRYGQQSEVHIYNLVAVETKEGRILERLFEKLSRIREQLGSDRVFDVIGEVLIGKSLKDLIIDAIANRRTMEDILNEFERIHDEEAIEKVREASLIGLATRHIDLTRILGEQRKAKEDRLVPEYVEEFFKKAASRFGIKMKKIEDGVWKISSVPSQIHNQSYEFKTKFGEVQKEYAKISFDKEKAFKSQAEFVAMGHPLLEAVINNILTHCEADAIKGATFLDPEGKKDGIIWFLEGEIKDGKNNIAGKKLFAVYQDKNNALSFINPAILWDLKPANKSQEYLEIPFNKEDVISFVIDKGLENYKKEILERYKKNAEIKRKYGIESLKQQILKSESKLVEYYTRYYISGEKIPDIVIQNEEQKKEEHERKKKQLEEEMEEEIEKETSLYFTEPKILGVVRVIPKIEMMNKEETEEIEKIGMEIAMEYEKNQGRIPEDVSLQNLGYDIYSRDREGNCRYIEVKARAKEGEIYLTPNEWLKAQRLKEEYWLYIVINITTNPELYLIQNPSAKLQPDKVVDVVRYVIQNWKEKAEVVKYE